MSAPILHGRRSGQNRRTPEPEIHAQGRSFANTAQQKSLADPRQVTVLTRKDWDRIQSQLNKRAVDQENQKAAKEERERLHQLSKDRAKNWSNTFAGQRQKKLEARKIREDKEEQERQIIDIEEAKFQAEKRKESIDKAKTQQYYETDRVKGFHGALLLTEVLKERNAQLELKELKKKASHGQDNDWSVIAQHAHEEAILKDQEEARDRIRKSRQTADFQKAQINSHLKQRDRQQMEDDVEGDELKRLSTQYEMEKKRLDEIRKVEANQLMRENLRQIEDVQRMKDIHAQQENEEDEECRIFAAAKRKMMKLRAEKEKQLHTEKQQRLENSRQKLYAQMQQKKDDEDDRMQKAVEESEEKRAREEAKKEEAARKMLHSIAEHRYEQFKEREYEASKARRDELEMLAVRREADDLFAHNEHEKQSRKFNEMKDLQAFHLGQLDDRNMKDGQAKEEQLEMDRRNGEVVNIEEKQFQEYARRVIEHCDKGGRNTYPLRKAAKEGAGGGLGPVFPGKGGVRPSYMVSDQSGVQLPCYQRGSTEDEKTNIYGKGPTSKRLGFVW